MDDLAAEAGITKPILYRHFGDRRGLARALRDSAFGVVLGTAKDDPASARLAARARVAALYPVVSDPDELRRVVVGFAVGFQMFVALNRNVYRFLRAEGVFDDMWDDAASSGGEPVAESIASSLGAIYGERGLSRTTAQIWAHALRGMVAGVVDWWSDARGPDRFEVERQFDVLTRALLSGLAETLSVRPRRAASLSPARHGAKTIPRRGGSKPRPSKRPGPRR
jgi:AcrR family transcriptional regulator